jgi:hypothetical protein
MKKLSTLLTSVALTLFASSALADDLNPPPWRGQPGTTTQTWEFPISVPFAPPDSYNNPYDVPFVLIAGHDWEPGVPPHEGIWSLSGLMLFEVPNRPEPNWRKEVWVQVTWQPTGGGTGAPLLYLVGDQGDPVAMALVNDQLLDGAWSAGTYAGCIPYNPEYEVIGLAGDIDVDQVVIDTWCIPEPQTYGMLVGFGLIGFGVWRRMRS